MYSLKSWSIPRNSWDQSCASLYHPQLWLQVGWRWEAIPEEHAHLDCDCTEHAIQASISKETRKRAISNTVDWVAAKACLHVHVCNKIWSSNIRVAIISARILGSQYMIRLCLNVKNGNTKMRAWAETVQASYHITFPDGLHGAGLPELPKQLIIDTPTHLRKRKKVAWATWIRCEWAKNTFVLWSDSQVSQRIARVSASNRDLRCCVVLCSKALLSIISLFPTLTYQVIIDQPRSHPPICRKCVGLARSYQLDIVLALIITTGNSRLKCSAPDLLISYCCV